MLIINLAPIDQSGRTVGIARYIKGLNQPVEIVSYKGTRNHKQATEKEKEKEKEKEIHITYIRNIKTQKKASVIRVVLLIVKFLYITIFSVSYLIKYKISLYSNKIDSKNSTFHLYSKKGSVLFVVPPSAVVLIPLLLAKALSIRVVIDWHRISTGWTEVFDRVIAGLAENLSVTQEMQEYFVRSGIDRPFLLTDLKIRRVLKRKDSRKKQKFYRKNFLEYLSSKYAEYAESIRLIKDSQRIGVCSTSFSVEENIERMLKDLEEIDIPGGGVLFLTTKQKVSYEHRDIQIIQVFLDYSDYLGLLSIADFGISTHQCRMDFPLKIVDYLEEGLTVLAHESTPCLADRQENMKIIRYTQQRTLNYHLKRLYTGNRANR